MPTCSSLDFPSPGLGEMKRVTYHHARHSQQNTKNNSNHNGSLASCQARFLRLLLLGLLGQLLGVLLGEQGFDKLLNLEEY